MGLAASDVRKVLDELLRTDADLVAFAMDAELVAAKRFSDGMDRVAKVNLLLQLHEPDEILARLRKRDPERTKRALDKVRAAVAKEGPITTITPSPSNPGIPRRAVSEDRRLTIRLTLDEERCLHVSYHVPVHGRLVAVRAGKLDELERLAPQLRYGGANGMAAVGRLLDQGSASDLEQFLTGAAVTGELGLGRLLYCTLFPEAEVERHVLSYLLEDSVSDSSPPPIRHGVEVRIWTTEPDLLGLPWRLCCWKGNLLADHGWTFAVTPDPIPHLPVRLSALSRVLVVAPQVASLGNLNSEEHIAELRQRLANGLPEQGKEEWFRVVHTRAELESALRTMPFDVLYYYGHGCIASGQVCLRMEDGQPSRALLTIADLKQLFADPPPKLVLLNACFSGAAGWQSAGHLLSPLVPVVVCSLTTAYTHYAGALAIRFLTGVLLDRRDPVALLHRRDPRDPAQTQHDFQWATHAVFASYTTWEPTSIVVKRHDPRNPLRLDRTIARAQVIEQVSALVEGSKRRVEAMVAYGQERSLLEEFSGQATSHLLRRRIAPVVTINLKFPQERTNLQQQLSEDFRQQVAKPGEPLLHALRRHAPQVRTAGKPVLWLNWGVCGDGALQKKLDLEQLRCWLKWSSEFLSQDRHCPEDLRIVSFVALRRPLDKYELLQNKMEDYKLEFGSDRFRAWLLTPLPRVQKGEIKDYLSDPDLCSCAGNSTTVAKATELIHRDTEGHYEQVVAHIEAGEKDGWQSLIDVLRQKHEPNSRPTESEDI